MYPASQHVAKTFEHLTALLPASEKTKSHVLLLAGEVTGFRNDTDRELVFRQESNFYYLTGCIIPGSFVLATYQPGAPDQTSVDLFIPKANQADIMWSVPPPAPDLAVQTHDVSRIDHPDALPTAIASILTTLPGTLFHTFPRGSSLFPVLPEEYIAPIISLQNEGGAITDAYLLSALQRARLTKDSFEIGEIRRANDISSRAHEVVMRLLGLAVSGAIQKASAGRPVLPGEWLIEKEGEAEAVFVASCRREGAVHQAYLPIVAASTRASTLHYCCNDREFAWGPVKPHDHHNTTTLVRGRNEQEKEFVPQVLLIDAGCEWNCYASDITRTIPVGNGGKFTPEARAIYGLVLKMQKVSFSLLRPRLHWDEVQFACHRTLVAGFKLLGIFKSDISDDDFLKSGVSAAFFPHGVGHSLGMDVHDVPGVSKPIVNRTIPRNAIAADHPSFYEYLRLRLPLEVGMVVTVEPGIYFSPHLLATVRGSELIDHEVLKRYEDVGGVRIEDVVVITETTYENLTTVRSDTDWVEGVCSGEL